MADIISSEDFSYDEHWEQETRARDFNEEEQRLDLKQQLFTLARERQLDSSFVYNTQRLIDEDKKKFTEEYVNAVTALVQEELPQELGEFLRRKLPDLGWH